VGDAVMSQAGLCTSQSGMLNEFQNIMEWRLRLGWNGTAGRHWMAVMFSKVARVMTFAFFSMVKNGAQSTKFARNNALLFRGGQKTSQPNGLGRKSRRRALASPLMMQF
jgi:hypothetical protein